MRRGGAPNRAGVLVCISALLASSAAGFAGGRVLCLAGDHVAYETRSEHTDCESRQRAPDSEASPRDAESSRAAELHRATCVDLPAPDLSAEVIPPLRAKSPIPLNADAVAKSLSCECGLSGYGFAAGRSIPERMTVFGLRSVVLLI